MFDDHANVSVDVQGSWEQTGLRFCRAQRKKRHGSGSPADDAYKE